MVHFNVLNSNIRFMDFTMVDDQESLFVYLEVRFFVVVRLYDIMIKGIAERPHLILGLIFSSLYQNDNRYKNDSKRIIDSNPEKQHLYTRIFQAAMRDSNSK